MGKSIADLFNAETEFNVKASEMYAIIREATKAEFLLNAAKCDVPQLYARQVVTGEKEETEIKYSQTMPHYDDLKDVAKATKEAIKGINVRIENDAPAAGHTIGSGPVGILRKYEQRVEWIDIQDIIRKGNAGASIPPGTEINFALKNGDAAAVVIVATDHYKKGDCVFWFRRIVGKHCMNEKNTNAGGFSDSDMKKYLDEIFDLLPDELQSVIAIHKTVQKIDDETIETEGRLFLMSMYEGRGANDWAEYNGTDKQIPYFEERRNRVAYDEDGDPVWYWTADPSAANTTNFCIFAHRGHSAIAGASNDGGVAPLFVIE